MKLKIAWLAYFCLARMEVDLPLCLECHRLIRETIYPDLQDHFSVKEYPHVPGVKHNLFFLDHDHPEQGSEDEGKSKSNEFEVKFSVAFARYLTQQGKYAPGNKF